MKKWLVRGGVALVVLVVVSQFIPVSQDNPPITRDIPTSAEVKAVLRRACYDCHSNETVWPWYSQVAPLSWWVVYDVNEGRKELNYSTWDRYSAQEQVKKLKESWKEIQEGEMPPWWYNVAHNEARLSVQDRELLRQWSQQP